MNAVSHSSNKQGGTKETKVYINGIEFNMKAIHEMHWRLAVVGLGAEDGRGCWYRGGSRWSGTRCFKILLRQRRRTTYA